MLRRESEAQNQIRKHCEPANRIVSNLFDSDLWFLGEFGQLLSYDFFLLFETWLWAQEDSKFLASVQCLIHMDIVMLERM